MKGVRVERKYVHGWVENDRFGGEWVRCCPGWMTGKRKVGVQFGGACLRGGGRCRQVVLWPNAFEWSHVFRERGANISGNEKYIMYVVIVQLFTNLSKKNTALVYSSWKKWGWGRMRNLMILIRLKNHFQDTRTPEEEGRRTRAPFVIVERFDDMWWLLQNE